EKLSVWAGTSASVAEAVNAMVLPTPLVTLAIGASTGAVFTSFTITVIVVVSLMAGWPLSVTRTVMTLVLGPCASVGVQLTAPEFGLIVAPAGTGASRLNVSVCAGASESVALPVAVITA